jgi:hypothetical protein
MIGGTGASWLTALRPLASPWSCSVLVAFAVGIGVLHATARCVQRLLSLATNVEAESMERAAAAAIAGWPSAPASGCVTHVECRGDERLVRVVHASGQTRWFAGRWLRGAAPAAFGLPLAAGALPLPGVGGAWLGADDIPRLDADELAQAARGERTSAFRRDPSIALRYLATGTDAPDYTFASCSLRLDGAALGGLVVVPGHLWIEPGEQPLAIALDTDLVIVAMGNVYCGRSLRIDGPGRLLLVAAVPKDATAFADADGNGRWSAGDTLLGALAFAGPIEGAGAVRIGIGAGDAPLVLDAGVFAVGQIAVAGDCEIAGPVVAAHRIVVGDGSRCWAKGTRLYAPERERIAGFATRGAPRASALRPTGPGRAGGLPGANQPLYAPVPLR